VQDGLIVSGVVGKSSGKQNMTKPLCSCLTITVLKSRRPKEAQAHEYGGKDVDAVAGSAHAERRRGDEAAAIEQIEDDGQGVFSGQRG
jgi:hypothetical protein